MRLNRLILAAAMMSLAACSKEEIPEVPKPEQEQTGKPEDKPEDKPVIDESICMKLSPTLQNMVEARSGVITQWQTGNRMGLFTEGTNLEYTYNGESWTAAQPYEVKKEQTVYAYHPYVKGEISTVNPFIYFDISKQEDVMYGQCTVNSDFTTAQPEMKHALSLVRVKVVRDEYLGEGVITDMAMDNVPRTIEMDYISGLSGPEGDERISIPIGGGFMLDDEHPTIPEAILPTWGSNYGISLSFSLDGKRMEYVFPESHRWEMGMIYTYTIKIKGKYNSAVNREDVPIDVQYWSQFGKTDDIVLKEIDFGDFENSFWISTNHTQFGYDCYQNEGKPFGLFYSHFDSNGFDGRMRFVFMRPGTDEIVEKFQPIDIKVDGWDGKKIQCYVTAAPGTYQLVPLFQRKGESTWFKARGYDREGTAEDWIYEVKPQAPDNLPSLRNIFLEKEEKNSNFFSYDIPYIQPFKVVYTLSNKGKGALKGEIKAVWEREFKPKSNSYRLGTRREDAVNDNQWCDEIGTVKVDIQPGIRYWKGVVECKVTKYYPRPEIDKVEYASPVIHLYWRAEGTQEWKLLRLDADYLFNRDYTGPDIWDETLNYISVGLEDWRK